MTETIGRTDPNAYASAVLRELLEERGMTAEDLAEVTGIGVQKIRNRADDYGEWWLREVIVFADALDVPIRSFFDC